VADDESGQPVSNEVGVPEAGGVADARRSPEMHRGEDSPVFRGTGVSAGLVVGVLLAILAIIVAVQNTGDVNVDFLAWEFDAPLVAVILAAAVAGVVLDETLGFFWRRRRRRNLGDRAELRRLRRS
jgi:uncharacterized integral membrane protein